MKMFSIGSNTYEPEVTLWNDQRPFGTAYFHVPFTTSASAEYRAMLLDMFRQIYDQKGYNMDGFLI